MFPFFFSLAIFVSYSYLYSCVQIIPPDRLGILNSDAYFQCHLVLTSKELPEALNTPFNFTAPYVNCSVTDWVDCKIPRFTDAKTDGGFCECTSKIGKQTLFYVFTLYINNLTQEHQGQFVHCRFGVQSVFRPIDLHGITSRPGDNVLGCVGQNLTLHWGFGFTYDFSQKYRLSEVTWKTHKHILLLKCINKNKKGYYNEYDCQAGEKIGKTDVSWVVPPQSVDRDLPRLVFNNVSEAIRNTKVIITIVFLIQTYETDHENEDSEIKRKRKANDDELFEFPQNTNETGSVAQSATTTPRHRDQMERYVNHEYMVSDTSVVDIIEPSSKSMKLEFTGTKSDTGQVNVRCEITKASKLGEPPVNLTIWHNDKVITTRENSSLLNFTGTIDKGNLTCNVVGESALCHGKSFLEELKSVLDVNNLRAEAKDNGNIDYSLLWSTGVSLACLAMTMLTVRLSSCASG